MDTSDGGTTAPAGATATATATATSPQDGTSDDGDSSSQDGSTTEVAPPGIDVLAGYWVWEMRVQGTEEQAGNVDNGQAKMAFGTGNDKCHYIWNETTGSDFHTECTYSVEGDMVTFLATADEDGTAAGYSCAHPDWTSWNDRPAMQWGRYQLVDDQLWLGVNTYWGFGGGVSTSDGTAIPTNDSLKRFPYWESVTQAEAEESWIVYRSVTREEWFSTYAISTNCQGPPELCDQLPGCGPGDKPYVD